MRSLDFLHTAKSCNFVFSRIGRIRSEVGIFRTPSFSRFNSSGLSRKMSTSGQSSRAPVPTPTSPVVGSNIMSTNPSDEVEVMPSSPFRSSSREKMEAVGADVKGQEEVFEEESFLTSWKWLQDYGPGFPVPGNNVKIIQSPDQFYNELVERSKKAKKRVTLSSLYLGSGRQETELVQILENNGVENSNLKIKVLLDFTRGSRGLQVSSRTMLLPLIEKCHDCQVFLYHTPQLRGLKKRWLPQRWNEVIGLQHMKIYIFDDCLIISGANLSADYFTNRQDRYFLIENCKELADFYDHLIDRVSDFSFQLDKTNTANLKPSWTIHPSEGSLDDFVNEAQKHIVSYYNGCIEANGSRLRSFQSQEDHRKFSNSADDTWIFPLIQMGGIGISYDKDATCHIFEKSPQGSHIKLATGYFNLTAEYINKIIQNSSTSYEILMAHPQANGFFGAKGFAGGIPAAYTLIAKQFLDNADSEKQMYRMSMREYQRDGWTYHAKGLWYYHPQSSLPAATLIGSPNFGHRSVYRDLETQLYLITLNPKLQQQLQEEQSHLFSFSKPFVTTELNQPNRAVPLWVRMVVMFFRNFF